MAIFGASALGAVLTRRQGCLAGCLQAGLVIPSLSVVMKSGWPCVGGCFLPVWAHAPSLIAPLGRQRLRVLSTSCSS